MVISIEGKDQFIQYVNLEMNYYLGAYYLIKLREAKYGSIKNAKICTCSTCINDTYFDDWCLSWTTNGINNLKQVEKDFQLSLKEIEEIQKWADQKFEEKKIGWVNTFSDLETLMEYKNKFFKNIEDYQILSINFPESEKDSLIREFEVKEKNIGSIGLWDNLNKSYPEITDGSEIEIGFDLIGVESGGDFHTFYCHDLANDLINKFKIKINSYGLIEDDKNWEKLVEYMNDEENGFEPVPWFFVKVKMIKNNYPDY
jgi:hypothetical protein